MKDRRCKTFLFSYYHDGVLWGIEIKAYDEADAKARIAKMPLARYDGELMFTIPVAPSWAYRLSSWIRRRLGGT